MTALDAMDKLEKEIDKALPKVFEAAATAKEWQIHVLALINRALVIGYQEHKRLLAQEAILNWEQAAALKTISGPATTESE